MLKSKAKEFVGYIFYCLVGAAIFMMVFTVWASPGWFHTKYEQVRLASELYTPLEEGKQAKTETDPLILECLELYRNSKTENIILLEYQRFDNESEADVYHNKYKSLGQFELVPALTKHRWDNNLELETFPPVVLLHVKEKLEYNTVTKSLICVDGEIFS